MFSIKKFSYLFMKTLYHLGTGKRHDMAMTEVTGDTNAFRAMAYGAPDPLTIDWCRQNQQQQFQRLDPTIRDYFVNQQMTNTSVFGNVDFQRIADLSKALANTKDTVWEKDEIKIITTTASLQNPPPVMVKWIMACPQVRELYHKQQLAGYDEYYQDPEPDKRGEDHYYYRRAINGLVLEQPDGELMASEWFEDLWCVTDHLSMIDQISIQRTWEEIARRIEENDVDPTSRFNAQL